MAKLELFYKETCPYCHRVMDFMKDKGISGVELLDIESDAAIKNRLVEVGGKGQVPCLFIDGKPLYESLDIIDYLTKEFKVDAPEDTAQFGGSCSIDGSGCH